MIFQKTLLIASITALSVITTTAQAVSFTTTFTGDNYVNNFTYSTIGSTTLIDTTSLPGSQDWTTSSTLNLTLNNATQYDFIWEVQNDGSYYAGFLADFTLGTTSYSTSTDPGIWSLSPDGINWTTVTSYGQHGVSPWGNISGISSNAEWIWDDGNNNYGETLLFKASIKTVSPIPEPSTYALMLGGLGLIGFMAHRRKRNLAS